VHRRSQREVDGQLQKGVHRRVRVSLKRRGPRSARRHPRTGRGRTHLTDFSGTGQYTIAGATGSKLAVVAQGGTGEATSTNVDTTADDPCKASCMVDVPDASVTKDGSALSIEITCSALTRVSASLCTRCVPTAKSIVRARTVPCRRE
jgi:hypothetical protein